MAKIFEDYLATADAAIVLLESSEVAGRWGEQSACEGFTVGGLAAHLAWQVQSAQSAVEAERPGPDAVVTELAGHYAGAAWLGSGLDSAANVGIRDTGEQRAEAGPTEVARLAREARAYLATEFASLTPDEEPVSLPWVKDRVMTLEDLLTTRLLELVIHTDDLAVSVSVPTPQAPDSAYERVIALLTQLAVRRHGQLAVLRALSRAERAPESIAVF